MLTLRGKERYEVDGKTILFVPEEYMGAEQMEAVRNHERIMISFRNENSGEHERTIQPSIMRATELRIVGNKDNPSGYYVTVEIDAQALPVSRREIDGAKF